MPSAGLFLNTLPPQNSISVCRLSYSQSAFFNMLPELRSDEKVDMVDSDEKYVEEAPIRSESLDLAANKVLRRKLLLKLDTRYVCPDIALWQGDKLMGCRTELYLSWHSSSCAPSLTEQTSAMQKSTVSKKISTSRTTNMTKALLFTMRLISPVNFPATWY